MCAGGVQLRPQLDLGGALQPHGGKHRGDIEGSPVDSVGVYHGVFGLGLAVGDGDGDGDGDWKAATSAQEVKVPGRRILIPRRAERLEYARIRFDHGQVRVGHDAVR